MPIVAIPIKDLNERLHTNLSTEEMEGYLEQLGCDIEEFTKVRRIQCRHCRTIQEITLQEELPSQCPECQTTNENGSLWEEQGEIDVVRMDLLPVRPDIFDQGGLSRALRGLLELDTGLVSYELKEATISVDVDPRLKEKHSYRPHIACAILRGLELDELGLRLLMKLQENLHWALGRDRKLASIGIYDLNKLQAPFHFRTADPHKEAFVPLMPDSDQPKTLQQILDEHPKGVAYAHLLKGFERYPLLVDDKGLVLSMPPIINSDETRVTTQTTDIFIDVTGITEKAVTKTLHTLITSLIELFPKARGERVLVKFEDKEIATPTMEEETFSFDVQAAARLIGISLTNEEAMHLLKKMRHDVRLDEQKSDHLIVTVPAYRNDIMHEVDLMEDLAIAYGYQNIERSLVPTMTVAKERPERIIANRARNVLTGLGFFETMSLMLSNAEEQYELLNTPQADDAVLLSHPASVEQTQLRTMLMPQLLKLFSLNRGQGLPQKLFEVDDVVINHHDKAHPEERLHLTAGILNSEVGFADLKSLSEAIAFELGMKLTYKPFSHPGMIQGRVAQLEYNGEPIGIMGEIHPSVLEKLRLTQPIIALELDLTPLCGGSLDTFQSLQK